jgi:hypothetical protein
MTFAWFVSLRWSDRNEHDESLSTPDSDYHVCSSGFRGEGSVHFALRRYFVPLSTLVVTMPALSPGSHVD